MFKMTPTFNQNGSPQCQDQNKYSIFYTQSWICVLTAFKQISFKSPNQL